MAEVLKQTTPASYDVSLELPISLDKIQMAMKKGGHNKAPGSDGIGLEFYRHNWEIIKEDIHEIINQIFLHRGIKPQHKQGITVCLPKSSAAITPAEYRPITLLNTDYKLIERIMVQQLRLVLETHLRNSQFCEVLGNFITEAVSTVREAIAQAEMTDTPLCVLTLDFQEAFDTVSHKYLFKILRNYGISPWFIERIKDLYDNATASVKINGNLAGPIPIQCGIWQGCLLSMLLYVLCLHPLLRILEENLPGIQVGTRVRSTVVVAYADDVTVFVTDPTDFTIIHNTIQKYKLATGACLNPQKSKALAIGRWNTPMTVLGINFHSHIKILGVTFGNTTAESTKTTSTHIKRAVQAQAKQEYARELCIAQRIQYVHTCLLAKVWYVAQIFPPPKANTQQLTTMCTWYIRHGSIFRVPVTTLQRQKNQRGWELMDVAVKCRTLLLNRMWTLNSTEGPATESWLKYWKLNGPLANPPHKNNIPNKLAYVKHYALDMAHITPPGSTETHKMFKCRLYKTLQVMAEAERETPEMRITQKHPTVP